MHPSIAALIAFSDGEANAKQSRRIATHLSRCENCSDRLLLVRSEKDELSAGPAITVRHSRKGLDGVLAAMSNWRKGSAASELRVRLREQIEMYFGSQAVMVVERPGMPAEELLGRTSELLEVFLGPAGAESAIDDAFGGLHPGASEVRR